MRQWLPVAALSTGLISSSTRRARIRKSLKTKRNSKSTRPPRANERDDCKTFRHCRRPLEVVGQAEPNGHRRRSARRRAGTGSAATCRVLRRPSELSGMNRPFGGDLQPPPAYSQQPRGLRRSRHRSPRESNPNYIDAQPHVDQAFRAIRDLLNGRASTGRPRRAGDDLLQSTSRRPSRNV